MNFNIENWFSVWAQTIGTDEMWIPVAIFRIEDDALMFINTESGGAYNYKIGV